MNSSQALNRIYYVFLFISLVSLVFYLGFLFGRREWLNDQPPNLSITNPNLQSQNSISDIQLRPILGSSDGRTVQSFGQLYFLINGSGQTEIVINLENVPISIGPNGGPTVPVPDQLSIEIAIRVKDQDNRDTYEYQNISPNPDVKAYIALNQPVNNIRSGRFTGIIDQPIVDSQNGKQNFERLVFRSLDGEVSNVFIDRDPDLPFMIRGNTEAGVQGQPAPFFWVKF
jgi:hypothetical protein